ncbi:uncharacterized protein LOC118926793 isoform X2 [Manis pentadactyla]|nr:uncharacterized protein LOC118926793 isoform X2 [Manis pentadactyla]
MTDAEATWFTDGSSYLDQGMCKAGAAVVDGEKIVWAQALPEGTSVQKAELIALTRALELGSGKKINIYTDSRYAFATAHVHGAIYQQRGLLTSEGREIKNKPEITALLEALHKPAKVSIIHCPAHQHGKSYIAVGNNMADQAAREAAAKTVEIFLSETQPEPSLQPYQYSPADLELISKDCTHYFDEQKRAWCTQDRKIILPQATAKAIIKQMHQWTHLGVQKLTQTVLNSGWYVPNLQQIAESVVKPCVPCQETNLPGKKKWTRKQARGNRPGKFWEIDFTEIKPGKYKFKYLLVFVDTFSGWVKAFPTRQETAAVVTKKILEEIFPRFGIPKVIGSDNGPAFIARISQGVAKYLGTDWKLHCMYRSQSSGQVERMN